jgi:uncharacterized membrane protein YadS
MVANQTTESGPTGTLGNSRAGLRLTEDWTAVSVGVVIFLLGLLLAGLSRPPGSLWGAEQIAQGDAWTHPLKPWLGSVGKWSVDPRNALLDNRYEAAVGAATDVKRKTYWPGLLGIAVALTLVASWIVVLRGFPLRRFWLAFPALFLLALLANLMGGQAQVNDLGLEYVLWALVLGLLISNTVGVPGWLRPAILGEQYIKVGLVLLGVEVLLGTLVRYGIPGVFVAWVVTPVVLISTYLFGQYVLRIPSKTLNMVVSADMSVCGVSAAIATASACRAKREELSLAIGLSMAFTVVMMVVLPQVCKGLGLSPVVAGAWIGGTIDSTGAVAAAGAMLGEQAKDVAITIKMIQNTLIGVVAFGVATYWVAVVEPGEAQATRTQGDLPPRGRIGVSEIWLRFPKFVLGFVGLSVLASLLVSLGSYEALWLDSVSSGVTKPLRGWLFCLAFVCIGLDSNFGQFLPHLRSGKPVVLYVVGQSLNLLLTLTMAMLMFQWFFPESQIDASRP